MAKGGLTWITKSGVHIPITSSGAGNSKSTNEYMNDYIRDKGGGKGGAGGYEAKKNEFKSLYEKNPETARTEFYKKLGMDGKPKVLNENDFSKIKDDGNPIMQRSTSEKGYNDLIGGDYRVSDSSNSIYGTGIYFAYGEGNKDYYAGLKNTQKVFEARVDKTAKIIDGKKLEEIKKDMKSDLKNRKYIDNVIFEDNGVFAAALGYDGIYYNNVGYGLILNRGKLIIKKEG